MEIRDLDLGPVRLVPANRAHARELARNVRPQCLKEIRSSGGFASAEPAVRMSINRSMEAWAAYVGDDLLCVFGVQFAEMPDLYIPWLLGTTAIDKHRREFWKASKIILEHMRSQYPVMVNMVYWGYKEAITWLKRLGFEFAQPERYGVNGELFVRAMLVTHKLIEVAHV